MNTESNFIVIGRFGRPHGVKGFVTINSFTEPRDNILEYSGWHAFLQNQWQPVSLLSAHIHNKTIIVQVEGYHEREAATALTNADIGIDKKQLDTLGPGEYYWHELIGMNVVNSEGYVFGTVIELMPTGSNDVLVVKGQKKYLIPFLLGQFIIDVSKSEQTITVDWDVDF